MVLIDPPYGLGVKEWDSEAFSCESLKALLAGINYVVMKSNFHLVLFCEWSSYPLYIKVLEEVFGPAIKHKSPLVFLKQTYGVGVDLTNAAEVAIYIRLGESGANFSQKEDTNNIFGSTETSICYLKDQNNKNLNPAQKPAAAIKQLLKVFTTPGDTVLDIFAGTGQVARAAVKLGLNSVSVEKDPIQVGFLNEFLDHQVAKGLASNPSTKQCNKCSHLIPEAEEQVSCIGCKKPVHTACSLKGDDKEDKTLVFCSNLCKENHL